MSEIHIKLSEIKKSGAFSIASLSKETGLSTSTIKRILKYPTYQGSSYAKKLVNQLYKEIVVSPFPEDIDNVHSIMESTLKKLDKSEYLLLLDFLDDSLCRHEEYQQRSLGDSRIRWLLGHIAFDRANYLRLRKADNNQIAASYYQDAYKILEEHDFILKNQYLCKIKWNMIAVRFNNLSTLERYSEKTIKWLEDTKLIDNAEHLLTAEPWQYEIARNALVVCSLTKNRDKAHFFATKLQATFPDFFQPDFKPLPNFIPAHDDQDLTWFIEFVLPELN